MESTTTINHNFTRTISSNNYTGTFTGTFTVTRSNGSLRTQLSNAYITNGFNSRFSLISSSAFTYLTLHNSSGTQLNIAQFSNVGTFDHTFSGLTNGTSYILKFQHAVYHTTPNSTTGTGQMTIGTYSPGTTPGTPTINSITVLDSALNVSYSSGGDNGGTPTYQYSLDGTNFYNFTNSITGLTNGTTYNVRIRSVTEFGTSGVSGIVQGKPGTVPGTPTNFVATAGNGEVSISFTIPNNNGYDITNYQYSLNYGSFIALNPAKTSSPITITGLTNGTSYQVRIRAVNGRGTGSATSESNNFIPFTTPNAPTSLVATPRNGHVNIAFTEGSNNGSTITNYQYSLDNGSFISLNPVQTSSPITITGLTNGTSYQVRLRAVNAAGNGSISSTVSFIPITTANEPTSLLPSPGNSQVILSFTEPSYNGGSVITNYEYSLNNGSFISLNPSQTSSPITITGLTNGTSYQVRIRAVNGAGSGGISLSSSSFTPGPPGIPTSLLPTPGNGQVILYFTEPYDNGSAITNYQYSLDNGSFISLNPPQTSSPITIPNLTNGTPYQVKIRAVNVAGSGDSSSSSSSFTPFTIPSAPTSLLLTQNNSEAIISFTEPSDDGGRPITNYEYSLDNGLSFIPLNPPQTSSPITINDLTNGTNYEIRLRAVNAAGVGESTLFSYVPYDVPIAPTSLVVTPGNNNAVVSFVESNDNGSPITNYEYSLNNGVFIPIIPPKTSSPITISGLTNGTAYQLRLRAINQIGNGDSSSSVSFSLPMTNIVYNNPTVISHNKIKLDQNNFDFNDSNTITISYNSITSNNGIILSIPSSGSLSITKDGMKSKNKNQSDSITLFPNKNINKNGSGVTLTIPQNSVMSGIVSNPPTNIIAERKSFKHIKVSFVSPVFNGGSEIVKYTAVVVGNNSLKATSKQSPITIGGLTPGNTYKVQVYATNDNGDSSLSVESNSITL